MKINPCKNCSKIDEDKNNPVCMNCQKRLDYVAFIEQASGGTCTGSLSPASLQLHRPEMISVFG